MALILLTGSSGQVGGELLKTLVPLGQVVAPSRAELDLTDVAAVRQVVRSVRPRWIINAAAYTAVDKAESERDLAYAINCDAVGAIAEEARAIGAGVIHFSTDYVFDGRKIEAYSEGDVTGPVSVYGASKLAGEQALAASGAAYAVFRTSWVYGATGKNFLRTILRLAREREVVRVVSDQHGAPTWSRDLAKMTAHVIAYVESGATGEAVNDSETSWGGSITLSGRERRPGTVSPPRQPGLPLDESQPRNLPK